MVQAIANKIIENIEQVVVGKRIPILHLWTKLTVQHQKPNLLY